MKKSADLFVYLLLIGLSMGLPHADLPLRLSILAALLAIPPTIYLYLKNYTIFVPALFFAILAFLNPLVLFFIEAWQIRIPQVQLLPAIVVYLGVIFVAKGLRQHVHWMKPGRFSRPVLFLTVGLVLLSSISLVIWAVWIGGDLSRYTVFIPRLPLPVLLIYGLLFPLFNSLFEEFISRAVLYDGFAALWKSPAPVILVQAAVFALWHYSGFPGGISGVVMVFCWSVVLGAIRHRADGMVPVLVAHYAADLTISLILFFMIVLPGGIWI